MGSLLEEFGNLHVLVYQGSVVVSKDSSMAPSNKIHTPNGLERCSHVINAKMEDFFGGLGYWVAGRPRLVMFVTLTFTVVSCFGFSHFVMIR